MATYPIKMMIDESGQPFVPLTSLDAVIGEKNLQYIIDATETSAGHFNIIIKDVTLDKLENTVVVVRWPQISSTVKPSYLQLNEEGEIPLYNGTGTEYLDLEDASNTVNILAYNGEKWILTSGAGSGSGHVITDEDGNTMEQQKVLNFIGFNVENDTANRATKIVNPTPINNLTTTESGQGSLDAYQGNILSKRSVPAGGTKGQVLAKSGDNDHQLEWINQDSDDVVTSDGSIEEIIGLTYEEYKALEAAGELKATTQYHIIDVSTGIEEDGLQDLYYDGTPMSLGRAETILDENGNLARREMFLSVYQGYLETDSQDTIISVPTKALMRNIYGLLWYKPDGTFIPLIYPNPAAPVYSYFSLKNHTVTICADSVFAGSEYILYFEHVLLED